MFAQSPASFCIILSAAGLGKELECFESPPKHVTRHPPHQPHPTPNSQMLQESIRAVGVSREKEQYRSERGPFSILSTPSDERKLGYLFGLLAANIPSFPFLSHLLWSPVRAGEPRLNRNQVIRVRTGNSIVGSL